MHVIDANEIFGTTFYTYDRIMEVGGKNGPDAFALYIKYLKQSRIQETNQTRTLNTFLREGLGRGDKRIKNARAVLKKLGLIDDIVIRDQLGKVKGHYVRVNYLINEDKVRTSGITCSISTTYSEPCVDESTPWGMNTNALSNININALSTQYKNVSTANEETTDISKEKKEKVAPKERKEKNYCEEFEYLWKIYPHWKGRGSKPNSYRKRLSWTEEEKQKILDKAKEKKVCCECGIDNKQYSKAFEGYMENERGVDFDLESFVYQLMENKKDKDNIGIKLAKEYWGEDIVQKFVKKYVLTHDTMTLDLH